MISNISGYQAFSTDLFGAAPASPQSARGESVTTPGARTEKLAASQANSPLYDQRAQLTDQTVAARAQMGETAARAGLLEQDGTAAAAMAMQVEALASERLPENPRPVEATEDTAARDRLRSNTQRALSAYGAAMSGAAAFDASGDMLSRTV